MPRCTICEQPKYKDIPALPNHAVYRTRITPINRGRLFTQKGGNQLIALTEQTKRQPCALLSGLDELISGTRPFSTLRA